MKSNQKRIEKKSFGFYNQQEVFSISITNDLGMQLRVTNFAATIMSLEIPDINQKLVNVVVGYESLEDYILKSKNKVSKFLGASIGRYAGRISNEKISINNKSYPLYHQSGVHLHGGKHGFDEKILEIDHIDEDKMKITFLYISKHLEEGYPGNLTTKVTYQLTNKNELKITYQATSDQDTVVNLTNHAYYNLNGEGTITDHYLKLNCSSYLEVDENQLPTGVLKSVLGTKFDFISSKKLKILKNKGIIDNTFIVDKKQAIIAEMIAPKSRIKMTVMSNQPGVVIYTPEKFPNWDFRKGSTYHKFPAICFETQNYPDAPNHNHFPSSYLKAGENYENHSVFSFTTVPNL